MDVHKVWLPFKKKESFKGQENAENSQWVRWTFLQISYHLYIDLIEFYKKGNLWNSPDICEKVGRKNYREDKKKNLNLKKPLRNFSKVSWNTWPLIHVTNSFVTYFRLLTYFGQNISQVFIQSSFYQRCDVFALGSLPTIPALASEYINYMRQLLILKTN